MMANEEKTLTDIEPLVVLVGTDSEVDVVVVEVVGVCLSVVVLIVVGEVVVAGGGVKVTFSKAPPHPK